MSDAKRRPPIAITGATLIDGTGALPVMDDVKLEAIRRHVELLIFPTAQAIKTLRQAPADTNAILHVTC